MFGTNPVHKQDLSQGTELRVQEVFHTIQGEGPLAGTPAVFVRMAGCNLRCHFCFVPSTMITMGDGTYKRIDQVHIDDLVLSWDGEKFVTNKVTKIYQSIATQLVRVRISGSRNIWCTPEHPFLVSGLGFIPAEQLTAGMKLVHLDNSQRMKQFNPSNPARRGDRKMFGQTRKGRKILSDSMRKTWEENPVLRAKVKKRMINDNPMRRPGIAMKGFQTRVAHNKFKMTGLEKQVLNICKGLPLDYVGDGKLIIGDMCPDFSVRGKRKLIEVWASDAPWAEGRGQAYRRKRRKVFTKAGYESLFLPVGYNDLRYFTGGRKELRKRVAQFINNGTTVLGVDLVVERAYDRLYGSRTAERKVFNLEVEYTHTYLANRVVVHNCDTEFDSHYDKPVSLQALVEKIQSEIGKSSLVVITGGEPLLQDIQPLCQVLINQFRYHVQIETAGTVWVPGLEKWSMFSPEFLTIVVSPKTRRVHTMIERHASDWKYIVWAGGVSEEDGLPIGSTQKPLEISGLKQPQRLALIARPPKHISKSHIFVQPCDDVGKGELAATGENVEFAKQLALQYGYRLSLQQHKILQLP